MTGQQSRPKNAVRAPGWDQRRRAAALCLALVAITFAVFGQTARHEFIGSDDDRNMCMKIRSSPKV